MYKQASLFFLIISVILPSCNPELTPASENMAESDAGKRKRIEIEEKETEGKRSRIDKDTPSSFFVTILPDEMMLQVFSELPFTDMIQASQVCRHWHRISEEPALWKVVRSHIHGDYPASEATQENAKKHLLRVHVNTLSNHKAISELVDKHQLSEEHPFEVYKNFLAQMCEWQPGIIDDYVAQGNKQAILIKIEGLANGLYGYEKDLIAAVNFIELFANKGNPHAIWRKIEGLMYGMHGYEQNLKAVAVFNDSLAEQGDEKAINRKITGLTHGMYGYHPDLNAAVAFNESLIEKHSEVFADLKVTGSGSESTFTDENKLKSTASIKQLTAQSREQAIGRKIKGLADGSYGYKKNMNQLKVWIEKEAGQGERWAYYLKAQGLKYGMLGFEQDCEAAIQYILKYHIPY